MMRRNLQRCSGLLIMQWGAQATNLGYAKQVVWIDTDPARGYAVADDVEDCWAFSSAGAKSTAIIFV